LYASTAAEPFFTTSGFHAMSMETETRPRKGLRERETVLVVVEEVLIRMVIADYLRQCGYKVVEATNADEAILVLEHKDTRVDVVFTTVEMPASRDGFELSNWVHKNRPSLKVVLAGSLARAASSAGDLCESGPHKKKPYPTASVIAQVNQLLSQTKRQKGRTGL
jgi:CheY-like chemotaxis protein